MKLIIHDLDIQTELSISLPTNSTIIRDDGSIKKCVGCFGCWIKTPGTCILADKYNDMGRLIAASKEVIIISRCVYGSFSPFIRNVLDRSIPYILPYLGIYNGEMHHKPRYKNHHVNLIAYFYGGDITKAEEKTARELVAANAKNFHANNIQVSFIETMAQLKGVAI